MIIPCLPSLADIEAIETIATLVKIAQKSARVVLNRVPANTELGIQARKAVRNYDIVCAPCEVGNRVAFIHAYNSGETAAEIEPNSKSTAEIGALYRYLAKEIGA